MTSTATTPSPDFDESLQLLLRLHELTLEDRDESEEADAVRDAMDAPWYRLTEGEAKLLRGLSADLYSIGADRSVSEDASAQAALTEYQEAVNQKDWTRALDVVRENQDCIPLDDAAFIRGSCWAHLGKFDVAVEFLQEAARRHPLDALREYWLLSCMLLANKAANVLHRARQIVKEESSPILLLMAASVLSVSAQQAANADERDDLRREAIQAARKGIELGELLALDDEFVRDAFESILPTAYLYLASNLDVFGQKREALEACAKALQLDSKNVDALMLQGWLNRDADPVAANADFHRGFDQCLTARHGLGLPIATTNVSGN